MGSQEYTRTFRFVEDVRIIKTNQSCGIAKLSEFLQKNPQSKFLLSQNENDKTET